MLALNLALRFALEIAALVALGIWGANVGGNLVTKIGLGILAPLAAAIVWGLFVSPKATFDVGLPVQVVIELLVFGAGVVALAATGRTTLAWGYASAVVLHELLNISVGRG